MPPLVLFFTGIVFLLYCIDCNQTLDALLTANNQDSIVLLYSAREGVSEPLPSPPTPKGKPQPGTVARTPRARKLSKVDLERSYLIAKQTIGTSRNQG